MPLFAFSCVNLLNLLFLFYQEELRIMLTCRIADLLHTERKIDLFFLAFFSCSGAVLGVTVAYTSESSFCSLMRTAASSPVSIVGLMLVTLFPFLITAIAFYLSKPYLLLVISFFESFTYALSMCSVYIAFLQAGWLVCMLLLFSDTMVIAVLHWYWIRNIHGFRDSTIRDLVSCIAVTLTVGLIDYIWVSPFLITLMND